jgi:hypothetical protein
MGLVNFTITSNLELFQAELSFLQQVKSNEMNLEGVLNLLIEIESRIENTSENRIFLIRLSSFIQHQTGL